MTEKIEIIPTDINWTPSKVNRFLVPRDAVLFYEEPNGILVPENNLLSGEAYSIKTAGQSYFLKRIKQDFDVDPAIEYLEGEKYDGLDIEQIANDWEAIGVSYFLSPDNPLNVDLNEFSALLASICRSLSGVLFIYEQFEWCAHGIYSAGQFEELINSSKKHGVKS
jgi:hypothetical protein